MKLMRSVGLVAVLAAVALVSADAQSLKLRQRMEAQDKDLAPDIESTNKACDTSISGKFDWTGVNEEKLMSNSAESYCDAALSSIRRICEDPTGKKAVKEKIKSVTCGFGADRAMTLKDGAIEYKINFESANDQDYTYEYLQNHL
jgi:hypothetical protein